MNAIKYTTTDFDKKKYVEENYELVAESWKDLQRFLKSFMVFLVIGITVSAYYLAKVMMM